MKLTMWLMNGATIPPIFEEVEQAPSPTFLIAVGYCSTVNTYIAPHEAVIASFPNIDTNTKAHGTSAMIIIIIITIHWWIAVEFYSPAGTNIAQINEVPASNIDPHTMIFLPHLSNVSNRNKLAGISTAAEITKFT